MRLAAPRAAQAPAPAAAAGAEAPARSRSRRRRGRVAPSSSTRRAPAAATATTTSWAIRSPACEGERGSAVGVEQQHAHLAAVAGVDEPGRVDERDRRGAAARPERGSTRPACPGGQLDRDAGGDRARRARAPASRPRPRRGRRPASPSWARAGSTARRVQAAGRRASRAGGGAEPFAPAEPLPARAARRGPCRAVGDREARVALGHAAGSAGATRTPSAVSSRSQVAGDVVQLGQPAALGEGQQQLDGPQRAREGLLDRARASSSRPSPVERARPARRRGGGGAAPRGASASSASALLSTSRRGRSPAPISSSTSSTARSISSELVLVGARRRRRAG